MIANKPAIVRAVFGVIEGTRTEDDILQAARCGDINGVAAYSTPYGYRFTDRDIVVHAWQRWAENELARSADVGRTLAETIEYHCNTDE